MRRRRRTRDDPAYVTRTKFLSGVALVTGGVLTAAILVPVIGFAVAESVQEEEWRWVDVGPLRDFPDGEVASLAVSGPPRVGPARLPAPQGGRDHRDLESLRAPRLPGRLLGGRRRVLLPLPRRRLRLARPRDRRPSAPAARPLRRQDRHARGQEVAKQEAPADGCPTIAAAADDRVLLGRAFSIDEDQQPYALKDPAEPVTGVLSNLYPF